MKTSISSNVAPFFFKSALAFAIVVFDEQIFFLGERTHGREVGDLKVPEGGTSEVCLIKGLDGSVAYAFEGPIEGEVHLRLFYYPASGKVRCGGMFYPRRPPGGPLPTAPVARRATRRRRRRPRRSRPPPRPRRRRTGA